MKKQLLAVALLSLALGAAQSPSFANWNDSFARHDHDHDGRWNYQEFNHANQYYYHQHPRYVERRDMRSEFNRLDANRDGYVYPHEVRSYRSW